MMIRIVIDDNDREENPGRPWTLQAFKDDDDGTPSRFPIEADDGSEAIVGSSIVRALRDLADDWEFQNLERSLVEKAAQE